MLPSLRTPFIFVFCACSLFPAVALASGFAPPLHYAVGKAPIAMALADFNHDGKADIATCNILSHDVSILLGNGDGTFQSSKSYRAAPDQGSSVIDLVAGDFNEDGKLDLVVTLGDNSQMMASLLLGKGDGSFAAPQFFSVGVFEEQIASADFNGDKHLDLFLGGTGQSSVMLGKGDGTFQAPVTYSTGSIARVTGLAIADLDGDSVPDVAAVNQDGSGTIGVLLGHGDGSFAPVKTFQAGSLPYSIAAADFNHDGNPDLALSFSSGGTIAIYLNNGDATFTPGNTYQVGTRPLYMAATDLDMDGNVDLAVATYKTGSRQSGSVGVLYGIGDGTFEAPLFYRAATNVWAIGASQFNSDQLPDIAVTVPGRNGVAVLINLF